MRGNTSVLDNAIWRRRTDVTITVDLSRAQRLLTLLNLKGFILPLGERYDISSQDGQDESTSADFDSRRVTRLPLLVHANHPQTSRVLPGKPGVDGLSSSVTKGNALAPLLRRRIAW